jgi:hypothetical protein
MRLILVLSIILLMSIATASFLIQCTSLRASAETEQFYVGVTFSGNTTAEALPLIDKVKNYTNLFVLQSGPVSKNETATTEICEYAVASGLEIIVYFGWLDPDQPWQLPWIVSAKQRWGDKFLGVYYYDEPGGIQLDYNWSGSFSRAKQLNSRYYQFKGPVIDAYLNGSSMFRNYDDAAAVYLASLKGYPDLPALKNHSITTFVSDYALYWFDYLGGYDVILAQFGWNNTLIQDVALVRGAARMQNKSWGAIITWKYNAPPYLDSGEEIYNQMRIAYEAGAKYVIIFNHPQIEGNAYGILSDEHFEALERFWNYAVETSDLRTLSVSGQAQAALVLPRNYGWGMRRPDDRIWYWESDEKSHQIWDLSRRLLSQYGTRLDIVYNDPDFPVTGKYPKIYFWNSTSVSE